MLMLEKVLQIHRRYIEFLYTFKGDDYMFDFDINMVNMESIISATSSYMNLNWYADLRQQEITVDHFNGSTVYYKYFEDDVDYLSETDDDEEQIKTKLKWVSFKQRFFLPLLSLRNYFGSGNLKPLKGK